MAPRRSIVVPRRLLVVAVLLAGLAVATAAPAGGAVLQTDGNDAGTTADEQTATGKDSNDGASNGTQDGDGDGGPLALVTGALGAVASFVIGALGAIASFLIESSLGHALVGIPLGIYLGLKILAYYIEYYQ